MVYENDDCEVCCQFIAPSATVQASAVGILTSDKAGSREHLVRAYAHTPYVGVTGRLEGLALTA